MKMRRPRLSSTSLPIQLLTVLVLPLLIVLIVVTFGSVRLHQIAMQELVAGHDVQAVRGAASSLAGRLEQHEQILAAIATEASLETESQHVPDAWVETLFDGGVALYDAQGRVTVTSLRFETSQASSALSPTLAAALERATPGGNAYFIPLIEPGQDRTRVAIILSPSTPPSGRPVKAIGIVSLNRLGLPVLLGGLQTSESAAVILAAPDGLILYHSDPALIGAWLPDAPHTRAALRGESGADYHTDAASGEELITSFAPVTVTGWAVMQEERWTEMVSPMMRTSQAAALVIIPGLAITGLAVLYAIFAIVRPLQRLEVRAADLAAGDFASIEAPVGGIDEIRSLQETLTDMAHQLSKAQAAMRHYIAAITQAQEDERLRLARELHDHTIQALIALDQREQMLKRHLTGDSAGLERLAALRQMTAEAIDDLRRVIRAMRPIYLEELGLAPALEMLARELGASAEMGVRFEKEGQPRRLSPEQEMTLYRVAQEALNNIRRHSRAQNVWLSIEFEPDEVAVTIRDDGVGFAAPQQVTDLPRNGHYGLLGMFERADLIDADLSIRSAPGKGTRITVRTRIPAAERPAHAAEDQARGPGKPPSP